MGGTTKGAPISLSAHRQGWQSAGTVYGGSTAADGITAGDAGLSCEKVSLRRRHQVQTQK